MGIEMSLMCLSFSRFGCTCTDSPEGELVLGKNSLVGAIEFDGNCSMAKLQADCGEVKCDCCKQCCYDTLDGCVNVTKMKSLLDSAGYP